MRFISWIIFLSIAAVFSAWVMSNNVGHVIIYWAKYRQDMSLNLFLFLAFGFFIVVYFVLRLIDGIISLPQRAARYRVQQKEAKAVYAITQAIDHLFAGRFAKALKAAQIAVPYESVADVAALIAANASHRLKRYSERDSWLAKVEGVAHQQSRLVMTAEMQLDSRDAKGALATIKKLQEGGARQFLVQHIALRANQFEKNWEEVIRITQLLAKREILHPVVANTRLQEAFLNYCERKDLTVEGLSRQWKELSSGNHRQASLAKVVAQGFIRIGALDKARDILENILDQRPEAELLELYPDCSQLEDGRFSHGLALIKKVEEWIVKFPAEPALQLALGRLCIQQQLWGKAKASLAKVIKAPRATKEMEAKAHIALSSVNETLEEFAEAALHYKEAVKLLL